MKNLLWLFHLTWLFALPVHATIVLDDTFADGNRTNQNLPTDAAWFVSSSTAWKTSASALTVTNGTSAILGVTCFAANPTNPISLNVGDTLTVGVTFTFNNLAPQNGSQGLRVGVYDLADGANSPKWPTTDLSGNSVLGSGVKGYSLFQNCGPTFNSASPMDLRSRTNMASASLLGTTSDHKLLVTGPGNLGTFTGFTAGTAYTLQFTLFRTNSTDLIVAATWQNPAGGNNLTVSYYDTNAATFNFDTFGLRPSSAGTSATNLTINEVRVELTSGNVAPSISLDPLDTSVYTGQTAFFSIIADGTAPLAYQWYFNTNTAVAGGTNAALTLNNVQLTDGGRYFCVVSNSSGTATSAVAQLTVTVPVAPSLLSQPADQTIAPGGTTHFSVNAAGSTPLSYQWYFNTNTPVNGLNDATLTLANVQATNVGTYQVVVNNLAGSVTSNPARLLLDQTPTPPSLITVPASVVTTLGSTASFTVSAAGSAPILFQWFKNSTALTGATNTILTLTNVQNPDVAGYTVQASNNVGKVVSGVATLTISSGINLPPSAYNLTGFAYQTTGGGALPETDPAYRKVTNALDLATALVSAYKTAGSVKVIEITTNLDLGWNEIGSAVQTLTSTPFRAHNPPQLHPRLLVTGVSLIDIKPRSGLTIFSPNGATIRHACFNLKSTANVILRNLKFDELWEWDE
ncbi:MAG TPA: immunoglobulin domain-containing protein, partial [Verrucomicrobiae bacterium]